MDPPCQAQNDSFKKNNGYNKAHIRANIIHIRPNMSLFEEYALYSTE